MVLIFGTQTRIFGTDMTQTKPKFMLIEHGRYFYQRKVPLDFQRAVGRKKWRAPLGDDFDSAFEKLKELRDEHTALLDKLNNPEERRDQKAKQRRSREADDSQRIAAEDAAYERWCHANGVKTQEEEYFEATGEDEEPAWEKAERWLSSLEFERTRDMTPTPEDIEGIEDLLGRLSRSTGEFKVELPPHPEYKSLVATALDSAKSKIAFASFIPEPMDDDEYHDRLVNVHSSLFGEDTKPPSDPARLTSRK